MIRHVINKSLHINPIFYTFYKKMRKNAKILIYCTNTFKIILGTLYLCSYAIPSLGLYPYFTYKKDARKGRLYLSHYSYALYRVMYGLKLLYADECS